MSDPTEPAASSDKDPFDLCGVTVDDKYRITSLVGSGGFGVVYRGVHTGFDEPIAVKCLKVSEELDQAQRDTLLARLQEEGRVLHRLSKLTSGIVQALDVGAVTTPNDKWVPYLVLEWLDGETLGQYLKRRRQEREPALSLEHALELLEPAARALAVAHKQKVAHRDVKPENLYLTEVSGQRTLKVLDFGIAKVLTQHGTFTAAPAATQKQASAFTPSYGAPEQFNKKRGATGPWTDVFALALIVVEAVSGERALDGDDATQLYIASADPASRPTLRHHGVQTSDAVEKVLARALAVDPGDRYQDAALFWDSLREAAGKKVKRHPGETDTSETGEFVSRHEIDLEPDQISTRRSPGAVAKGRPPDDEPARAEATNAAEGGARAARQGAMPATRREGSAPASGGMAERTKRSDPSVTATQVPQASMRWMPVVVVLALAAAGLLYVQLRNLDASDTAAPLPGPRPKVSGARTPPSSAPAPSASQAAAGGADAGDELDAGADADAEAATPVPPNGMVFVPRGADAGAVGFFLDVTEVTAGAYQQCVMAGTCTPATRVVLTVEAAKALGGDDPAMAATPEQLAAAWEPRCNALRAAADHPINCVKHPYAVEYCRFRGKRLPTSAEWSIAAGAGSSRFPWGDDQPECTTACYGLNGGCVGSAREVASCAAGSRSSDKTAAGALDLAGNLAEWVSDPSSAGGGDGPAWRVLRGGSFTDEASMLASSTQRAMPPSTAHVTVGFRCALDAPQR